MPDVIDMMANHLSTREFICVKLVNKFVGDEIVFARIKMVLRRRIL